MALQQERGQEAVVDALAEKLDARLCEWKLYGQVAPVDLKS
jgi:hypothetical protein